MFIYLNNESRCILKGTVNELKTKENTRKLQGSDKVVEYEDIKHCFWIFPPNKIFILVYENF